MGVPDPKVVFGWGENQGENWGKRKWEEKKMEMGEFILSLIKKNGFT